MTDISIIENKISHLRKYLKILERYQKELAESKSKKMLILEEW